MPTRSEVMKARTPAGGWRKATLDKWGVPWPPTKGWIERLTGELGPEKEKPMTDWQPIQTAPRDGTHILVAFGEDVVSVASYHRSDAELHPWKFLDSQGSGLPFFNGARDDQYGPTHWMPLPKAPSA